MSDNLKNALWIVLCFVWGLLACATSACAFNEGFFYVIAGLVNLAGAGFGIYLCLTKNKDKS